MENRNLNSAKLLEVLRTQEGCLRRFYDQVFREFARGEAGGDGLWMSAEDFLAFCSRADVVNSHLLADPEAEKAAEECAAIFSAVTNKANSPVRSAPYIDIRVVLTGPAKF